MSRLLFCLLLVMVAACPAAAQDDAGYYDESYDAEAALAASDYWDAGYDASGWDWSGWLSDNADLCGIAGALGGAKAPGVWGKVASGLGDMAATFGCEYLE